MSQRIVVIGSGLGGLASACTLAARGHEVTVVERNEWLGGKAAVLERAGFRFDMGPTILMLPSVLRRIFEEAGRSLDDYLELVRLDPQWRCFFDSGSQFDLIESTDQMAQQLAGPAGKNHAVAGYRKFLSVSKRLHEISDRFYFWKSIGAISDAMSLSDMLKPQTIRDLIDVRFGRSVAGLVRSCVPDDEVAQMLDHFTQYVGSSPSASPAALCGIAHMQTTDGVWYPMGGTRAIPEALVQLGTELGVTFVTGEAVGAITTDSNRVTGVELENGERIDAAAVVSNSDSVRTHDELLDDETALRFRKRRSYDPACSGVVLYLGLKKRYEHLLHHNFVFSRNPEEEFEYLYEKGEPAPDPTCYVCAPSMTDSSVAPTGAEALYILIHSPYLRPHHDWSKMLQDCREGILQKLRTTAGMPDIDDRIVFEDVLTPEDIDRRYHVLNGAIYGLASHGRFLGVFKPANRSPDVRGLYLAGGSAHPGPGMPMVLMSGWIAADAVHQDIKHASAELVPA